MSIKFKHCCVLSDLDYIEVDKYNLDGKDVLKLVVYDSNINTEIDLYLDKKTAIRFSKSVRTEIAKII